MTNRQVFVVLMTEMVVVSLLVMPLPHPVRRQLVNFALLLWNTVQIRVTIFVTGGLITLLFVDAAQRSVKYPIFADDSKHPVVDSHLKHGYNELLNSDQLAKKFYHQRNFYLTGIVIYLSLAIPTIINLLNKIVKWDDKFNSPAAATKTSKQDLGKADAEIEVLKKSIAELQQSIKEKEKPVVADKKND